MRTFILLTEPKGYSLKAVATLRKLGPVATWQEAKKRTAFLKRATVLVVKLGMRISEAVMDKLPN